MTFDRLTFTLFRRKTGRFGVRFRIRQIDLLVRTVEITAANHRLLFVQLRQVGFERLIPIALFIQIHELRSGVGYVNVDLERRVG